MPVSVTVTPGRAARSHSYPCLLRHRLNDVIVLFGEERRGTVVANPGDLHFIGEHKPLWDMEYFMPFEGKITLTN